jgi:hypothetical protein
LLHRPIGDRIELRSGTKVNVSLVNLQIKHRDKEHRSSDRLIKLKLINYSNTINNDVWTQSANELNDKFGQTSRLKRQFGCKRQNDGKRRFSALLGSGLPDGAQLIGITFTVIIVIRVVTLPVRDRIVIRLAGHLTDTEIAITHLSDHALTRRLIRQSPTPM